MAEYKNRTIKEAIEGIRLDKYVLPAMQRNFVWPKYKVVDLFDSFIRDYPIGTFLFWIMPGEDVNKYVFNKFVKKYDESVDYSKRERVAVKTEDLSKEYVAVLDGQQRLTSIYLGVLGSFKEKTKGMKKTDPNAYCERTLYMNVLWGENLENPSFRFMTDEEAEDANVVLKGLNEDQIWIRVRDIYCFKKISEYDPMLHEIEKNLYGGSMHQDLRERLVDNVSRIYLQLCEEKSINYYEVAQKTLGQIVEIFVRVNSGGERLSAVDLMLSIASGEQAGHDMHEKIKEAINLMAENKDNFVPNADFLLTLGLLCTGAPDLSIRKKSNYDTKIIGKIFKEWDAIIQSLLTANTFVEKIGIKGKNISASVMLTISYFFYKNPKKASDKVENNVYIRQWIVRTSLTTFFGEGTGEKTKNIKKIIDEVTNKVFPLEKLMEKYGNLKVSSEINNILRYTYKDPITGLILRELAHVSGFDSYDVDHIWPESKLKDVRAVRKADNTVGTKIAEEFVGKKHCLCNLQMLTSHENRIVKVDRFFDEWVTNSLYVSDNYKKLNCIPTDTKYYPFSCFLAFLEKREELMKSAIIEALPDSFAQLKSSYNFSV